MNKRIVESLLAASLFVLTAFVPAAAQTYNYSVYIDSDNNAGTGCNVVFPGGTISGAEVHLQATVNAGVSPSVVTVTRETCSGGTFGAGTVIGGGYPVGLGNGLAGASVVELNDTLAAVQGANTGAMRLYVVGTSDIGDDVLLSTNGALNGAPILFTPGAIQPSAPAQPIPTFGIPALLLLIGLVVFIGARAARRRMRRFAAMLMLICGIAWAGTFVSDGQVGDWIGYSPIASDPAGDSTSGQAAIDLRAFFAATQTGNIFFRVDVANVNALSPPITVSDSYTASAGVTLNIAAPGVLNNDTINSATISAHTAPTHGALTLNADGSFAYTPTAAYTGSDSFTYTLTNSGGTSSATVTFTVVAGPVAVADSYTTSIGTGLNISASGVLSNDQLGAPPATMSSYGGGSLGGSVTDNTPGVAASGTLGGAALTFNADGSFVLGAPTTAGTYTILYRIGNSQGTSDGIVTVQVNDAPAITSANTATFNVGSVSSFSITSTGTPNVTISESGVLPSGVIFTPGSGGTATLSGTPAAGTSGNYPLALTATNGVGSPATQNFTLVINQGAAITSANSTTFTVGTAGTFSVTDSGVPIPTLSESGTLPGGVTFVSATGILSGTPTPGMGGSYPITFTATNGVGSPATQNFTLIVDQAPTITSVATTTFTVGSAGTFSITTTGNPNAAITETGTLPGGITLTDNGNGTATLAGTPAAGAGGSYPITITANNGVGSPATQNFTLVINQAPAITSANTITFTVGTAGSFTVVASGTPAPNFSETGALPSGVTLNASSGILAGTPVAGSGGSYAITLLAANGVAPSATQTFTLIVNQVPAITSANTTTFTVGSAGSFSVVASGYPGSNFSETGTLPTGVTLSSAGLLSGTPATGTAGNYPLTITANNGVGSPAIQSFTLTVLSPCAVITVSGTLPNGLYQTAYSSSFTQTGGTAPVTWSATGLPAGLSINTSTGVVSGSPTTTVAAASVTINVSDVNTCPGSNILAGFKVAPVAIGDSYTTVGNTPLQVGGTAPATPYVSSATSIFGNDSGPGTLTTTAGIVATSLGGSVTIATNGSFVYTPKVNTTGADTFSYSLIDGNGVSSAATTVTITASGKVWYVDGSAAANGNGEAATPFNTLVSASSTHAAGDTIFVGSAGAATTTPGAISLKANSTLWGQGTNLPAVSAITIQNTAATSKPKLTGTVTLAGNTVTVSSLDIATGAATGFTNTGTITGALVENGVTVTTTTGTAVSLSNTAGNLTFLSVSANGAVNGISLNNQSAGTFTVTGTVPTAGSGGSILNTTGSAVLLTTNAATTSFNYMTLTSSATNISGVDATDALALIVANSTFNNFTLSAVRHFTSVGSTSNGTFNIHNNTTNGISEDVIDLQFQGSGTFTGHVNANTIGTAAIAGSGSSGSTALSVQNFGTGVLTIEVNGNHVEQVVKQYGMYFTGKGGTPAPNTLNLTLTNNIVHMATTASLDAITVIAGVAQTVMCVNVKTNTATGTGTAAGNGLFDSVGLSLEDDPAGSGAIFAVQGYSGAGTDYAAVQNFVNSQNTFSAPGGPSIAESLNGSTTGFSNATCPTAP